MKKDEDIYKEKDRTTQNGKKRYIQIEKRLYRKVISQQTILFYF